MVEIDREQFAKLIKSAWKVYNRNVDDTAVLNFFWNALKDHTLQQVSNAISVHLKTSAHPPRPADINKIISPKGSYSSNDNSSRFQCDHSENGQRCKDTAVLSPATNGSGPWYCSDHFFGRQKNASDNTKKIGDLLT